MSIRRAYLTTIDNPYDPSSVDDFRNWWLFDVTHGYNSCDYLGRVATVSDSLSEVENAQQIESAIDDIIKQDFMNIYKKVVKVEEI